MGTAVFVGCSPIATPHGEPATTQTESPGAPRIASVNVVKVATEPAEIARGASAETLVKLKVQSGYHINANPPTFPYLKATELEIPPSEGVSVSSISYPAPLTKKFPFAEKPLAIYEGESQLKIELNADKSAKTGTLSLAGKLRVQACDDQVCYPPGTIELSIPLTVK
jgi:DsbC/DsbD-like thiol-disulfide interchange protein